MKKIEDFENKMVHNGKRNVRHVLVTCERCGTQVWKQWHVRIRRGDPQYCSRECFDDWQREQSRHIGKENARFHWNGERWIAQWWEDGKLKNTTKAYWLWEKYNGEVPEGYWVTYKDGNAENCELDNLELISRGERMSGVLLGREHSEETKRKLSKAHRGKILSDEHKLNISNSLRKRWAKGEFDDIHLGENSPMWRGGVSKEYPKEYYQVIDFIRERDNFTCKICGDVHKDTDRNFSVHHINGNKDDNNFDNLITLCPTCHGHVHGKYKIDNIVISAFRSMLKY